MRYSIDRFENNLAVLIGDDESVVTAALSTLPAGVRQGDLLVEIDGVFALDAAATARRREEIRALEARLRRKE